MEKTLQSIRRSLSVLLAVGVLGGLIGCTTTPENPDDPYEEFNRTMFKVNEGLDTVFKPVAQVYDAATPLPVRAGVGNFFSNIADVRIAVNNLLQGKIAEGFSDIGRFLINTIVGIGGVFDVASEMGLEKNSADFGQTLGTWGVGEGSFFYWPLIGPSTTRDTFAFPVDWYMNPFWHINDKALRNSATALRFLHIRAGLLPAEKVMEQAAFDKYSYLRDAYLQNRRRMVPGKRPAEDMDFD